MPDNIWPPYTVISADGTIQTDCHNLATAKVIAERHIGSKIRDNDRGVFIQTHPLFGLKQPVTQS